jgi:hypothetical protein
VAEGLHHHHHDCWIPTEKSLLIRPVVVVC